MVNSPAEVVKNNAGTLTLSATRQGSCSRCSQSQHCALLWTTAEHNKPLTLTTQTHLVSNEGINQTTVPNNHLTTSTQYQHHALSLDEQKKLKPGDKVNISCDEKKLLRYICLLFIPTLLMLLTGSVAIDTLYQGKVPAIVIVLMLTTALLLGGLISRLMLAKVVYRLASTTITAIAGHS